MFLRTALLIVLSGNALQFTANQDPNDTPQAAVSKEQSKPDAVHSPTLPIFKLQVLIAEVERQKLRGFGFDLAAAKGDAGSDELVGLLLKLADDCSLPQGFRMSPEHNFVQGILETDGEFRGYLRGLKEGGQAKILHAPTFVTCSGRLVSIVAGGEFPQITPEKNRTYEAQFVEYGHRLEILPTALEGQQVSLAIKWEQKELDYSNATSLHGFTNPALKRHLIESLCELQCGQTVLIAGVICKSAKPSSSVSLGIPNLPLLSRLFHQQGSSADQKEVVILVTPGQIEPLKPLDLETCPQAPLTVEGFPALGPRPSPVPRVRVIRDPELQESGERELASLEATINEMFPESHIRLVPLANKVVVMGEARDAKEASQMLAIVKHHDTLCANEEDYFCRGVGGCLRSPEPIPAVCSSVINMLTIRSTDNVVQTEMESDADQPHAPAILLTPADGDLIRGDNGNDPRVRLAQVRVHEPQGDKILFGQEINCDAGLVGKIVTAGRDSLRHMKTCRQSCCEEKDHCPQCAGTCFDQAIELRKIDSDECDDDDEADDAVESFIEQVLQSQMQHLESMMHVRLAHERELFGAKAAADSAVAKLKVEHAEEILELRVDHLAEIQELKEAMWQAERKWIILQHQQALEEQRHVSELRSHHADEMQAQRIVALETEIQHLQEKIDANGPECKSFTAVASTHPYNLAQPPNLVELPIRVEDLASGRVRYSPVPPKPSVSVGSQKDHDSVERVEFSTPPLSTNRSSPTEVDRLRHEVARLRSLVEDLLCIAPESPPAPKPHVRDDEDED